MWEGRRDLLIQVPGEDLGDSLFPWICDPLCVSTECKDFEITGIGHEENTEH